ncbi:GNAT family N-acetyltransferase [Candidatus Saccharibacteria bacterium]|nr:GNAT family N-acetyltransferase [Candidatus Saccharibacteria bacterium]
MMKIIYKTDKNFSTEETSRLFAFTGWTSSKFPNHLARAINGADRVVSAWDDDKLIGLVSAIDDGAISMFLTFTVVLPEYQGHGIGQKLVEKLLENYRGFGRQVLTTEFSKNEKFYARFGFEIKDNEGAMFLKDWPESDILEGVGK